MRLVEFFTVLDEARLVSPNAAAKFIAMDDELFEAVAAYATWPDSFEERPDKLKKFLYILSRVKPFKIRLYRGEPRFEWNNYQPDETRGFTSWTPARDTAEKYFADHPSLMVKYTDGPVQAIKLEDIAYWRTVLTDESHYGSSQAEHFVLEPVERKVPGVNEEAVVMDPTMLTGTFVGAKLCPDTETRLLNWLAKTGMQNATPREDLHITIAGNKTRQFPWKPREYPPLEIDPSTMFLDAFGEDDETLVLRFDSPELEERHQWALDTYGMDWDFEEYRPHITLGKNTGVNPHDIPEPDFPLFIAREYSQPWDD